MKIPDVPIKYIQLLGGIGGGLFLIGFIMWAGGLNWIVHSQIQQKLSLQNDSMIYPLWQHLPIPLTFNVYMFNVTNPAEVSSGSRPILKEIGPFCYDLYREKVILEVSEDKESIEYYEKRTFYPKPIKDKCLPLDTEITMMNMALMGTVHIIKEMLPDMLSTIDEALPFLYPGITSVFTVAKVEDVLFNGLLLDCSADDMMLGLICQNIKAMGLKQVRQHPNGRDYLYSTFTYLNNTNEGPFRVNSGISNVSNTGLLQSWNGKSTMNFWTKDECNEFKGTDGYIIPAFTDTARLDLFQVDMCRSLYLMLEKKTEIFDIPVSKYSLSRDVLANIPENRCYCPREKNPDTDEEETHCLKSGVINVKACYVAPVILSFPHFYLADEYYLEYAIGLSPDKEIHDNYLYIETMSGAPVKGIKRAQINMHLIQSDDIAVLNEVREGLFPILWLEEGAQIPSNFEKELKMVHILLRVCDFLFPMFMFLGLCCLGSAMFLFAWQRKLGCFAKSNIVHTLNHKPDIAPVYTMATLQRGPTQHNAPLHVSVAPQTYSTQVRVGP